MPASQQNARRGRRFLNILYGVFGDFNRLQANSLNVSGVNFLGLAWFSPFFKNHVASLPLSDIYRFSYAPSMRILSRISTTHTKVSLRTEFDIYGLNLRSMVSIFLNYIHMFNDLFFIAPQFFGFRDNQGFVTDAFSLPRERSFQFTIYGSREGGNYYVLFRSKGYNFEDYPTKMNYIKQEFDRYFQESQQGPQAEESYRFGSREPGSDPRQFYSTYFHNYNAKSVERVLWNPQKPFNLHMNIRLEVVFNLKFSYNNLNDVFSYVHSLENFENSLNRNYWKYRKQIISNYVNSGRRLGFFRV